MSLSVAALRDFGRLPMSTDPLSADVFIIHGQRCTYFIDCGSCDAALDFILSVDGSRNLVLTHFHADHSDNMKRFREGTFETVYGGKKTIERIGCGTIVNTELELEEGIRIIPITNCHAKGSLAVELDGEYLFTGDALCGCDTPQGYGYNAGMLLSTIRELEKCKAKYIVPSHSTQIRPKDEVLTELRKIYSERKGNDPYIII